MDRHAWLTSAANISYASTDGSTTNCYWLCYYSERITLFLIRHMEGVSGTASVYSVQREPRYRGRGSRTRSGLPLVAGSRWL